MPSNLVLWCLLAFAGGTEFDYDFTCPWRAPPSALAEDGFCNPICVANITDCPEPLVAAPGYVICGDGFQYPIDPSGDVCTSLAITDGCADNTACGLTVACLRDIPTTDCAQYTDLMVANIGCEYDYDYAVGEVLDTSVAGFSFVCIWFSVVCGLSIAYTWFNQYLFPVGKPVVVRIDASKSTTHETKEGLELQDFAAVTQDPKADSSGCAVQTGYQLNPFGIALYGLLIVTAWGFQIVLSITTASYYAHETPGAWQPIPNYFQGLQWFIITWHVSSFFMIALFYPANLFAVFYRRCELKEATRVEMWHRRPDPTITDVGGQAVQTAYRFVDGFLRGFRWFMETMICFHAKRVNGASTFCKVTTNVNGARVFTFQLRQFVLDEDLNIFKPAVVALPSTCDALLGLKAGLTAEEAATRRDLMGPNLIEVPPPSLAKEFFKEFSRGFYVYQIYIVWSWLNFSYWHMGILLTIVFSIGGVSVVLVSWNNAKILATLIGHPTQVTVLRGGERKAVDSGELVPGDVVEVNPGLNTCDMVLISGKVVLDESSLTGESMPVAKDPIEARPEPFSSTSHKKSVILAGTTTMQGDKQEEVPLALVLATGGNSEKGIQIRDILFRPVPMFKFNYQVRIVVFILGCLAVFGGILTVHFLGDKDPNEAWFYAMYVVASALPPLLPTVFVVSVGLSSRRLLEKQVVCSEPPRLLMAGKVRVACFDKTGTLTKQGMDFYGVRPVSAELMLGDHQTATDNLPKLQRAMATCQALSKTSTGMLIGTAVDLKMFEASGWHLEGKDDMDSSGAKIRRNVVTKGNESMTLVWQFDFDRHRMTMGVVVRDGSKHFVAFKGSAEAIAAICKGVPADFAAVGEEYASQGCYTLGIAARECTPEEEALIASNGVLDRNALEQKLDCLGFLTFKNEVKPDSAEALRLLREGAVRVVMITGDHPLTAVKIASELALLPKDKRVLRGTRMKDDRVEWVDQQGAVSDLPEDLQSVELVVNGVVFRAIKDTKLMVELLTHVRVFARMSPDDKVAVVTLYIQAGFVTAMCGDGGNDCGALRAAHVGVALSDAEASVVSPFTGVSKSAMAMVDVLLEGRCGLASAFACYKNVVMYGLVETLNQILNAYYAITFSEWCWVMLDGLWVMYTSFALATAKPAKILSSRRPTGSPLDIITFSACFGLLVIHVIFLAIAMNALAAEDWYKCRVWDTSAADIGEIASIGDNYETSVIFLVTGAQMLHNSAAFNFGSKHRAMWITNWRLGLGLIAFYLLHFFVVLYPGWVSCFYRVNCVNEVTSPSALSITEVHPVANPWGVTLMPASFRWKLFVIIIFNLIAACAWEYLVITGPVGELLRRWKPRTRHLRL